MTAPAASVIVPVYNEAEMLREALSDLGPLFRLIGILIV